MGEHLRIHKDLLVNQLYLYTVQERDFAVWTVDLYTIHIEIKLIGIKGIDRQRTVLRLAPECITPICIGIFFIN